MEDGDDMEVEGEVLIYVHTEDDVLAAYEKGQSC
jgi:hypothetical protein